MTELIEVSNLTKVYPDGTKAVDGISFKVKQGEFFGFLGPNGAGKSTTIKVLTTLLHRTSGSASVAGFDVEAHPGEVRKLIGIQSQETVVDYDLTGRENMVLQGNMHQMKGESLQTRVNELLKIVGLTDVADKRAAFYSGGLKKRLDLASILVHRPKVLFLDEPTTGLDPQARTGMWEYLKGLNRDGTTIFLTTQYMEEADKLCDRLSIIDQGKIVAQGSPKELKAEIGADAINVNFESNDGKGIAWARETGRQVLSKFEEVTDIVDSDTGLTVYAKNGGYIIPAMVRAFDEQNVKIASLSLSGPTLDDVFLKHTGRRIRVEELLRAPRGRMMFGRRR